MYCCADCSQHGCMSHDMEKTIACCPCKEKTIQADARVRYQETENQKRLDS